MNQTINYVQDTTTTSVGIVVSLIDGVYSWFYNIIDFAGNTFITNNNTVTIDTLSPNINFVSPNHK